MVFVAVIMKIILTFYWTTLCQIPEDNKRKICVMNSPDEFAHFYLIISKTVRRKNAFDIKYVFKFSAQLLFRIVSTPINISRLKRKMSTETHAVLNVKWPLFLPDFNQNWNI
jgi:hypothetical protein